MKIPFIVNFAVEPDETTRVADLVFPDLHQLEKLSESLYFRINRPGLWYGGNRATKPPFNPPYDRLVNNAEVLLEVAKGAGFIGRIYDVMNQMWNPRELSASSIRIENAPIRKWWTDT